MNMEKGPTAEHNEPIQSDVLAAEASQAAAAEHEMSLWQAIKTYPKAIGWSVLLSSTLIMGKWACRALTRRKQC
jgi:SP family general alpha glucoside:H+ symporter-like MFS transporter